MEEKDLETSQIQARGVSLQSMVQSEGWKIVKGKFTDKLLDLQSIRNLPVTGTPTQIKQEIAIRNTVSEIILEVLKEIEGEAEQYKGNNIPTPSESAPEIIRRDE